MKGKGIGRVCKGVTGEGQVCEANDEVMNVHNRTKARYYTK